MKHAGGCGLYQGMTRALLVLLLLTSSASAQTVITGVFMYKPTGLGDGLYPTPDTGCIKWAEYKATQGYFHTFEKVEKSKTDEWSYTCWFRDQDSIPKNKLWDQVGGVEAVYVCPVGTTPFSQDNSGSRDSQRCSCPDTVKDCSKLPLPPGVSVYDNSGAEVSERCTQRAARAKPATVAEAKRASAANKDKASSTKQLRRIQNDYKKAKQEIVKQKMAELDASAAAKGAKAIYPSDFFPDFKPEHMCDEKGVTVTDVNIGWLCGSRSGDFAAANNVAGYGITPPGCTWHHHEDFGRMQLVKSKVHADKQHVGGVAIWKQTFGLPHYP